jgi:hypothetical protein
MTEPTTISISLDDMSLDELVQLSQGLGHQADKIREQRLYLAGKIRERIARGQATAEPGVVAPGALIETSLQG